MPVTMEYPKTFSGPLSSQKDRHKM